MPRQAIAVATLFLSALFLALAACDDGGGGGEEPTVTAQTTGTLAESTATEAPPSNGAAPNIRDVDLTMEEGLQSFLASSNGQVDPARIIYADLTEDGVEDAVVPVGSGGEGGDIAAFAYTATGRGIEEALRVLPQSGRVRVSVEGADVIAEEPVYAAGDPLCCPSELQRTTYRWDGSALALAGQETVPAEGN